MPFRSVNRTVVVDGRVTDRTGLAVPPSVITVKAEGAGSAGLAASARLYFNSMVLPAASRTGAGDDTRPGTKLWVPEDTTEKLATSSPSELF